MAVVERTGLGTVANAKRVMSEAEFRQWCYYLAREPSAGDRTDEWMPLLVATVHNANPFRAGSAVKPERLARDRWGDRPAAAGGVRFSGEALADMLRAMAGG